MLSSAAEYSEVVAFFILDFWEGGMWSWADIGVEQPACVLGVDPLVGLELLCWFSSEILRGSVPAVQTLGSPTIYSARHLCRG